MKPFRFIIIVIACFIALSGCGSKRITVTNTGEEIVEIKNDHDQYVTMLGQNGTGYFDIGTEIQIGDALVKVGRQIEIMNTGSGTIQITYREASGAERNIILGECGIGYVNQSTPIEIGDARISLEPAR